MLTSIRLVLVCTLLLIFAACSQGLPAIPGASTPLVTIETRGGECIDGPCGSQVVIERDGTVRQLVPAEAELGKLPPDALTALDAAIKTADFSAIRAVPFQGECPVNFDGQEFVYEFGAPGGVERIASCETAIDDAHPVFAALTTAFAAVGVLPAG
ncbi:hypothetical protein BH20CHL7_BH20CHL7_06440 [soil metagenome]